MIAHVISGLFHHGNCIRVDPTRFQPCAVNVEFLATQLFQPGLGYLAAAGIAGAEEEDFGFFAHEDPFRIRCLSRLILSKCDGLFVVVVLLTG
jgi:hypothetical protein